VKILFLFWDMARVNLLNSYDKNNRKTSIDVFLDKIGGTLYTNCYTPAPDTPRSLACMQTGLYPSKNGCDSRIKWPAFFLNNVNTIFDLLDEEGFKKIFYMTKEHYDTGPFNNKNGNFFHEYSKFLSSVCSHINSEKDLFAYISLQDYHWAIDDYGGTHKGVEKGQDKLVSFTESFFKEVDIDNFDYIITFSDHGHKMNSEILKEGCLELLNDDRSKILMHIRKKFQNDNVVNPKLCSILDIPDTIRDILGLETNKNLDDGISLLLEESHSSVVLEDHLDFSVSPIQGLEQWGCVTDKEMYITNIRSDMYLKNNIVSCIDQEQANRFIDCIALKSPKILEYQKKINVLNLYSKLKEAGDKYSDNSYRDRGGVVLRIKNIWLRVGKRLKI